MSETRWGGGVGGSDEGVKKSTAYLRHVSYTLTYCRCNSWIGLADLITCNSGGWSLHVIACQFIGQESGDIYMENYVF